MNTRRHFLAQSLAAAPLLAGIQPSRAGTPAAATSPAAASPLCFFTKHLQGLSLEQIAEVAAEMGLNGVESPIRPKGHIEPERVPDELPRFVEALKRHGLELTIMTSGINEVSAEQHSESVLRTAAKLGVKRFRMHYFKYDLSKPIWPQLQEIRPKLRDLVALCDELGILPMVQNHSGRDYVGAPIWDMYSLMQEYQPTQLAFCYDILHATVEGGLQWPLSAALTSTHRGAVYFKDFQWQGRKSETCPLGEGQVDPAFAKQLVAQGYRGPISLHVEYLKGDARRPEVLAEFKKAHVRDLAKLKSWLAA